MGQGATKIKTEKHAGGTNRMPFVHDPFNAIHSCHGTFMRDVAHVHIQASSVMHKHANGRNQGNRRPFRYSTSSCRVSKPSPVSSPVSNWCALSFMQPFGLLCPSASRDAVWRHELFQLLKAAALADVCWALDVATDEKTGILEVVMCPVPMLLRRGAVAEPGRQSSWNVCWRQS